MTTIAQALPETNKPCPPQGRNPLRALRRWAGAFTAACLSLLPVAANAAPFTTGNLAIVQADASANNTTASVIELSPSTASQTPSNTIPIDGTTLPNELRFSGSATSTLYLSRSADGTLLTFNGVNSTNTASNVNSLNPRGVGTINAAGTFALATSYTGNLVSPGANPQTRSATSLDNVNWFIADQNGLYTNNGSTQLATNNLRSIRAFGGVVYCFQASATIPAVSTVSGLAGTTITALPGLPNGITTNQDFYLVSSGDDGTYDVLYVLAATSGTAGSISKYSLVAGSWTANGSYATAFGGFGLAAANNGAGGASLWVSTGTGASLANSVIKLTDAGDEVE